MTYIHPGQLDAITLQGPSAGDPSFNQLLGELVAVFADAQLPLREARLWLQQLRDPSHLATALCHLRELASEQRPDSTKRLRAHVGLLRLLSPARYDDWRRMYHELWAASLWSSAGAPSSGDGAISRALHELIVFQATGSRGVPMDARDNEVAFLRAAITLAEQWDDLSQADPNLGLLFAVIARYGSVQRYYRHDAIPQRAVQRLSYHRFDAEYLVYGREDILCTGGSERVETETWADHLVELTRRIIGTREAAGEFELGVDRRKVFHQIHQDLEEVKQNASRAAGLRMVGVLLDHLKRLADRSRRKGQHGVVNRVGLRTEELQSIRRCLEDAISHSVPALSLRAIRSPKHAPELLFDNARFACCLFKPAGLFHTEITRLLLNPATPMIELWLSPFPEFLGLVTLYPGVNERGERTMLVDTVDYDDRLLELRGYNATMRFILDAIIADAHRARAMKVAVFAAPYGKPLNFANSVRHMVRRRPSMTYADQYYFESADPEDTALADSRTGKHHYTVALGHNRPMRGVIDYGFNYIGYGRVHKLYDGGRGVIEIDVERYLSEAGLDARPASPTSREERPHTVGGRADPARVRDPRHIRLDLLLQETVAPLWSKGVEVTMHDERIAAGVLEKLSAVERLVYSPALRYDSAALGRLTSERGTALVTAREHGELVGFALTCEASLGTSRDLRLHDLAVIPSRRGLGIGHALINAVLAKATMEGYRYLYTSPRDQMQWENAVRFYSGHGFTLVGGTPHDTNVLRIPLGIMGPWRRPAALAVAEALRVSIYSRVPEPAVSISDTLSGELLSVIRELEGAFPPSLRYDEEEFAYRFSQFDAFAMLVRDRDGPVAFTAGSCDPRLPADAIYLDSISVSPKHQKRGIGSRLHAATLQLVSLAGYAEAILFCAPMNHNGVDLPALYRRYGAVHAGGTPGRVRMVQPLPALHAISE